MIEYNIFPNYLLAYFLHHEMMSNVTIKKNQIYPLSSLYNLKKIIMKDDFFSFKSDYLMRGFYGTETID